MPPLYYLFSYSANYSIEYTHQRVRNIEEEERNGKSSSLDYFEIFHFYRIHYIQISVIESVMYYNVNVMYYNGFRWIIFILI